MHRRNFRALIHGRHLLIEASSAAERPFTDLAATLLFSCSFTDLQTITLMTCKRLLFAGSLPWTFCSRLYRSLSLQENNHFAVFFEIDIIYSLLGSICQLLRAISRLHRRQSTRELPHFLCFSKSKWLSHFYAVPKFTQHVRKTSTKNNRSW